MAYTPELSDRSSCTLRRIAWSLNMPMTKAIEKVIEDIVHTVDRKRVCQTCKDMTRCDDCAFNKNGNKASSRKLVKNTIPDYDSIYKGMQFRVCLVKEGRSRKQLTIQSPLDVYNLVKKQMCQSDREMFLSILLTANCTLIGVEKVSVGTLDMTHLTARELFKSAILANACSVIICHNHPSGNLNPSRADIAITQKIISAGELLNIPLHDHVLISHKGFKSLREINSINWKGR